MCGNPNMLSNAMFIVQIRDEGFKNLGYLMPQLL